MMKVILAAVAFVGLASAAQAAGETSGPPVGTRCVAEFYALGYGQVVGTNVMVFEQGGLLHRWRLQADASPARNAGMPINLSKFTDMKTSTIEFGNFSFGAKNWTMRSKAGNHVWYGAWNGTTLDSAADVSGEYPALSGVVIRNKNVDCSGSRSFAGG